MAVDARRAAYRAAGNVARKIGNMSRAEILILGDILDFKELFQYWNELSVEDLDKIVEILKKSAERK